MTARKVKLREVIQQDLSSIAVDANESYPDAGILNRYRGMFAKPVRLGEETSYKSLHRISAGQLIYSKLFAWEGAVAVVPHEFDGYYMSSEFPHFYIDTDHIEIGYLQQTIQSDEFFRQLAVSTTGMGQRRQRVNVAAFESIEIPLPSIEEQRRIVERMEAYAVKAAKLESSKAIWALTSEQLHQKLVEPDAPRRRVGDLIELQRRKVDVEPETDYREIGLRSFGRGVFHKLPVSGFELGTKKVYAISPGDLLVSNVFAWEGAVAVAGESESGFIGSHRFMTWTPKSDCVNVHYLATYFTSKMGIDLLRAASPGSAGRNKTLSISTFENLQIPLPDMEDQQRIAQSLQMQSRLSALHAKRSTLATALPKAMRNEIFSSLV